MKECLYQNRALEGQMYNRLYLATGYQPGSPVMERRVEETAAIIGSGEGTLFALAWALTEFSLEQGYPVSFRGQAGSLLVSHLLGFAQNNPMELDIPWQGAFSAKGRAPQLILNVAPELYKTARRYLKALAVDCDVLWNVPGEPEYRVIFAPDGYDPEHFSYLTMDIRPHELMSYLGQAARRADAIPSREEVLSPEFIQRIWADEMWDLPILQDLEPLRDRAPDLTPTSFADLIRMLGLLLAPPERQEQLDEPDVTLDTVIATREDLYESLLRDGVSQEAALSALRRERGLYPRAMCAEYLTYALLLAWYRNRYPGEGAPY